MKRVRLSLLLGLSLLLSAVVISPLLSQSETIITLNAPAWLGDVFRDELFDSFEAEHPGVKVVFVPDDSSMYYGSAAYDPEGFFKAAETYAATADVLYIDSYNFSVEATRAGYYLDLSPLIASDTSLKVEDFIAPIWQSFQWDGGVWALPVSASVDVLVYDAAAFDAARLPYPDEHWTLDDLASAARALTVRDENGRITVPGFAGYSPGLLFRGLLGEGFYDGTTIPNPPRFNHPDLPALMAGWQQLQQDLSMDGSVGFDFNAVPMMISQPWQLISPNPDDSRKWAASLLPGGVAGLSVQGFAVSRGTLNPQLAYELAKFITTSPEIAARFYGNTPARRSLIGVEPDDEFYFAPRVPEEVQALIDRALEHAIPASELRFAEYVNIALNKMSADSLDAQTALQEVEIEAQKALQMAAERRETTTVMVSTPVPTPSVAAGQIVLRFGLNLFTSNYDMQAWKGLVDEFRASHPAVGNIDLVTQFYRPEDMEKIDCYYQPYNPVPDADLSKLLALDPFIDADPAFDRSDVLGDTMARVQRQNRTWAYPIALYPGVLWYNTELFAQAGLLSPEGGWTADQFDDALRSLAGITEQGTAPFIPQTFGNTYLLMLMAAYGGVPYDYRTTPATIRFTDPATVAVIRQVLDLAKQGLIHYNALAVFGGGGGMFGMEAPIYSDTLSTTSFWLQNRGMMGTENPYRLALYPRGSDLLPVSYGTGVAVINASAQNPEACYQWIASIARRPDLFSGVPARRSLIDDPAVTAVQGEDVTRLYRRFADLLTDPKVIVFPEQAGSGGDSFSIYIEQIWMNRVFDNYVLKNGDLETGLADAELMVNTYRDCIAPIPPFDPAVYLNEADSTAYFRQYTDCAILADPTLKEVFSYYYEESR